MDEVFQSDNKEVSDLWRRSRILSGEFTSKSARGTEFALNHASSLILKARNWPLGWGGSSHSNMSSNAFGSMQ
jgi:hypothetical protein